MLDCWAEAPEERPTFTALAKRLEALLASVHDWHACAAEEYLEVAADEDSGSTFATTGLLGVVRRVTGKRRRQGPAAVNPLYDAASGDQQSAVVHVAESRASDHDAGLLAIYDMGDDTERSGCAQNVRHVVAGGSIAEETERVLPGGFDTLDSLNECQGFAESELDWTESSMATTAGDLGQPSAHSREKTPAASEYIEVDDELEADESASCLAVLPAREAEGEELYLNRTIDGAVLVRETRALTAADVGARVHVEGYSCKGTLRFFGTHRVKGGLRCGVELDQPLGKNNGTVGHDTYFSCAAKHGLLVVPGKVKLA